MRFTAQEGGGEQLASLLVEVADSLRGTAGCLHWIVSREAADGDAVWVQELWESREAAEAALSSQDSGGGPRPADVMALVDGPPERTDLVTVGGVGLP